MTVVTLGCLEKISNFLGVPSGKLKLDNSKLPTCNINNKPVTGFINIAVNLAKGSKKSLLGSNLIQETEIRQWLEYCLIYASQCNNSQSTHQVLNELNCILELRTYLVGNSLSIADLALFFSLHDLMEKLTYQEKEKYLNVSRWFDNIQQNSSIRSKISPVDFSTLFLTSVSIH